MPCKGKTSIVIFVMLMCALTCALEWAEAEPYRRVVYNGTITTNAVRVTPALVITMDGTNKVYEAVEDYMARTGSFSGNDWVFTQISIDYPVSGIRSFTSKSVYIAVPKRGREDAEVRFTEADPSKIKDL